MTAPSHVDPTDQAPIQYSAADGVGTITLNRPENRNAITAQMMARLFEQLSALQIDKSVHVLILRGEGKHFSAGLDIAAHPGGMGAGPPPDPFGERFEIARLLHELPQVTIAAVRGGCAGAAFGWAMACDFRVASKESTFNIAFLDVALAGDMGCPWTLPALK